MLLSSDAGPLYSIIYFYQKKLKKFFKIDKSKISGMLYGDDDYV